MIFESRPHIWAHCTHDLTDCHQNTVMRLYSNIWFGHGREEWLTALGGNMEIITGLEQGAGLRETLRTNYWKRCRKCAHGICLPWDWITVLGFKLYLVCLPFYTVCTWSEKKASWELEIIWINISSFWENFSISWTSTVAQRMLKLEACAQEVLIISLTIFYC